MRTAQILAAMCIAAFLFGCPDAPIEPPLPLEGTYSGTYAWIPDSGTAREQHVIATFTTNAFFMELDTALQPESLRVFCDFECRYQRNDEIVLLVPPPPGGDSIILFQDIPGCYPDWDPLGEYRLDQSVVDRIVMTRRNVVDSCIQRLTLFKISGEF